jgi:hypothetical protein
VGRIRGPVRVRGRADCPGRLAAAQPRRLSTRKGCEDNEYLLDTGREPGNAPTAFPGLSTSAAPCLPPGPQYTSIAFTERLAASGISGSAGPNRTQTVSCPVRPCRQVEVPLRRFPVITLGYGHRSLPVVPRGTARGTARRINPSAASAVHAMTRAISAASAHGARGRASCKRLSSWMGLPRLELTRAGIHLCTKYTV